MERTKRPLVAMIALAVAGLLALAIACGSTKSNTDFGGGDTSASDAQPGADDAGNPVMGFAGTGVGTSSGFPGGSQCPPGSDLSCYVDTSCPGGKHTTITGKVYDPAGKNPLYNIAVFVPKNPSALPAITPGTSVCTACSTPIEDYVAIAQSAEDGSFTLTDVPSGKNVPIVLQVGKWRRVVTIPSVADCGTTKVPDSGTGQARLPRNHKEGDLPQMALLTGGLDDLGCFMTRMGIDASEYSAPHGGGRLDIYQGLGTGGFTGPSPGPGLSNGKAGDCTNSSCPLWASKASFESYDIVLLACEGDTFDGDARDGGFAFGGTTTNVTPTGKQAMHDWLNEGGKVFATHFHYTWFAFGPADFQGVASWLGPSVGNQMVEGAIDTTFVKGQAFHNWLKDVGALDGTGALAMTGVAASVSSVNAQTTSRWIYDSQNSETKYMSFETPIGGVPSDGGAFYCGKAVFTDLHAGGAPMGDVPGSCQPAALSQQEKALEFLFFDLAACVTIDMVAPPK
ncbi:MAG TPA: hypothetical protein VK762_11425 [Polyangiaceae bacterium]|nr:hypothetical protein [Polyangiaceae bacterium]